MLQCPLRQALPPLVRRNGLGIVCEHNPNTNTSPRPIFGSLSRFLSSAHVFDLKEQRGKDSFGSPKRCFPVIFSPDSIWQGCIDRSVTPSGSAGLCSSEIDIRQ